MIEKHIVLEDVDPVVFYGVNNTNIQMIKALYPKLRIVAPSRQYHQSNGRRRGDVCF